MIKSLLSLAGFSLIAIFAGASVTSGLVENAEIRAHAIDGIKTAIGLPYGTSSASKPIQFQIAQSQNVFLLAGGGIGHVISPISPVPSQPPVPPQPPEVVTNLATSDYCVSQKSNCQSACF